MTNNQQSTINGQPPRILVILPTYNEAANIKAITAQIIGLQDDINLLIIDDNSPDGTGLLVKGLIQEYKDRVFLISRPEKSGLGSAYIEGFKFALKNGYDYAFEMDADFSHDPKAIPGFLKAFKDADVVVGSRYIGGIRIINWPLNRLILSYCANIYTRWLTGLELFDATSGFKCFSKEALGRLPLSCIFSNGYAFQIEVNSWCQRLRLRVKEIPIIFTERKFGSSKMSKEIVREAFFLVLRLFIKRITKL